MKINLFQRLSVKVLFVFSIFISMNTFSQNVGEGELLTESSLENSIKDNIEKGLKPDNNIYINHHFMMDISEKKVSDNILLGSIKKLPNVIDATLLGESLIVVTRMNVKILPSIKQQLSDLNISLVSDYKLYFKSSKVSTH
jgi:hypothetical protein